MNEGLGRSTRQLCDQIATIMNTMPIEDREQARTLALGYETERVTRPTD